MSHPFAHVSNIQRNLTDEQIENLAHALQGTCSSIEEQCRILEIEKELTLADCHCLDDKVFECHTCGWWYEISEMSEQETSNGQDLICQECEDAQSE